MPQATPKKTPSKPKAVSSDSRNLWQRISAVREELKTVARDKSVDFGSDGKYMVATHEAIRAALRPLMAKHGLVDYVSLVKRELHDTGVVRGKYAKRPLIQYQGEYAYLIVNADDPEDQLSFPVEGHGDDAGDKGPGKASTYALKTGQKIIFLLDTGDDGEEDRPRSEEDAPPAPEPLTPKQVNDLGEQADKYFGSDAPGKLEGLCSVLQGLGVIQPEQAIKDIPREHFEQAINLLKNQAIRDGKIEPEGKPPADDDV